MSFIEKCDKLIPIGKQKFAYQCENVEFDTQDVLGRRNLKFIIEAFVPANSGCEPYPNTEADDIISYELRLERFTSNSIQIEFIAKYVDGTTKTYSMNTSFSILVNSIFEGNSANIWIEKTKTK